MVIRSKKQLYRYLFLYRSFLFHFVSFKTSLKDSTSKLIINALNIKNRYQRIYYVIDHLCDQIDDYYKDCNTCQFSNGKCICHRTQHLDYQNGCCRKCQYQSSHGCTTKNFACKMFYCSFVKDHVKVLKYSDLKLLYVLNPLQRFILKSDYFRTVDEVTKDLYYGPFIAAFRECFGIVFMLFHHKKS